MVNEITGMTKVQVPISASDSGMQQVRVEKNKLPEEGNLSPPPTQTEVQSVSKPEIREAVSQVNDFIQRVQRDLSFSMDEGSGETIISVTDSESGKLIRQIPSEEVLALAGILKESADSTAAAGEIPQGILFSKIT